MMPTPAIIEVTMIGPMTATIASLRPRIEGMSSRIAPQKTRLSRSRRLVPMVPARVIVSAWKEIVATELNASEPAMPISEGDGRREGGEPVGQRQQALGDPVDDDGEGGEDVLQHCFLQSSGCMYLSGIWINIRPGL